MSCDDHEFWNDFPETQIHVPLSWDAMPRRTRPRGRALRRLPGALNPGGKRWYSFDMTPVSFFIADTRSNRTRDSDPDAALMLERPVGGARAVGGGRSSGPGVLVLPQPLLKEGGSPTDRTLVDFKESDPAARSSRRALGGQTADGKPHDILILTGDIHTGRVSSAEIVGLQGASLRARRLARSMVTP